MWGFITGKKKKKRFKGQLSEHPHLPGAGFTKSTDEVRFRAKLFKQFDNEYYMLVGGYKSQEEAKASAARAIKKASFPGLNPKTQIVHLPKTKNTKRPYLVYETDKFTKILIYENLAAWRKKEAKKGYL